VREAGADDQRLVGYYVTASGAPLAAATLRDALAATLPAYMIPQHFVHLDAMPITPNGKLDRKALPEFSLRETAGSATIYADPVQAFLADLWAEVLGCESVGPNERFFEIGGTSLTAAKIVNRLQDELGEFIYVISMFDAPTIESYAEFLKKDYITAVNRQFGLQLAAKQTADSPVSRLTAESVERFEKSIPHFVREQPTTVAAERNPPAIFVLAPPRSGTTLLRVMLAGHPQLFAASELQLLLFESMRQRNEAFEGKYKLWLEGLIRAVMEIRGCSGDEAWKLIAEFEAKDAPTKACYREIQDWIAPRILVDKSPSYARDMAVMAKAERDFDAPLYIHLSRHPHGMIHSFCSYHFEQVIFLRSPGFRGQQLGELIWQVSHRNILQFLDGIPAERQFSLRFEDLVGEPETAMRNLSGHFGLAYNERLVDPYSDIDSKMVDGIHADSIPMGDTHLLERTNIDPAVAEFWKRVVSEDFLSDATWQIAKRLGYDRDDFPGHPIDRGDDSESPGRFQSNTRRQRRMKARRSVNRNG